MQGRNLPRCRTSHDSLNTLVSEVAHATTESAGGADGCGRVRDAARTARLPIGARGVVLRSQFHAAAWIGSRKQSEKRVLSHP